MKSRLLVMFRVSGCTWAVRSSNLPDFRAVLQNLNSRAGQQEPTFLHITTKLQSADEPVKLMESKPCLRSFLTPKALWLPRTSTATMSAAATVYVAPLKLVRRSWDPEFLVTITWPLENGPSGQLLEPLGDDFIAVQVQEGLPRPSNVVPFWGWYSFWVRTLIRTTKKVLHWRV